MRNFKNRKSISEIFFSMLTKHFKYFFFTIIGYIHHCVIENIFFNYFIRSCVCEVTKSKNIASYQVNLWLQFY